VTVSVESFITKHLPGFPQGSPEELRAAADCWAGVAGSLRTTVDDAKGRINGLTGSWQGDGKNAFEVEWGKLADAVDQGCDEMSNVASQLRQAAGKLEDAQRAYEVAAGAAAVTAVVGVAFTLVTFGASDEAAGAGVAAEMAAAAEAAAEAATLATTAFSVALDIAVQICTRFVVFLGVDLTAQAAIGAIVYPDHDPLGHLNMRAAVAVAVGGAVPELPVSGLTKIALAGATAAGFDAAGQEIATGHVDPGEVLFNGVVGGATAGVFVGTKALLPKIRGTGDPVAGSGDPVPGSGLPDPNFDSLKPAEQASLLRLREKNPDLGIVAAPRGLHGEDPGYEYVDAQGNTYDQMGHPNASKFWATQRQRFLDQIRIHLTKSADYVVIDLNGFTPEQIAEVSQYVDSLPEADQARIIRLGF